MLISIAIFIFAVLFRRNMHKTKQDDFTNIEEQKAG